MLRRFRYSYAGTRSRALVAEFPEPETVREGEPGSGSEDTSLELFAFGSDLGRHLPASGRALLQAWLLRFDLENLKVLCRGLMRRKAPEDFHPLFIEIPDRGSLSPERLRKVETWEALLPVLRHTLFEGNLPRHPPNSGERPLFHLETSLEQAFWKNLSEALNDLPFSDRAAVRTILFRRADLDRWAVVHRGLALGLETTDILSSLPLLGTIFSPGEIRSGLSVEKLSSLSRRGGVPEKGTLRWGGGECHLWRRLQGFLLRRLRDPPFTLAPCLSAFFLKEIELRDRRVSRDAGRLARAGAAPDLCLIRRSR